MKYLWLATVPLVLLLGAWWFTMSDDVDHVVYMYNDRFEPSEITIDQGEAVLFVSKADRAVWPASDSHPSHQLYPEFDPLSGISSGDSWSFVFDQSGSWDFHDHLSAGIGGTVNVVGEFGDVAYDCIADKTGVSRAVCWEADFLQLITQVGLDQALDKFVELYESDPEFVTYCHDIMHYVGRAAYDVYDLDQTVVDRPETQFCGYGFYHGFIEESLEKHGAEGLAIARSYCQTILDRDPIALGTEEASFPASACWHGVGHAVFDSLDGSMWGDPILMVDEAINVCEDVFSREFRLWQCGTGVFNSLANAMVNQDYYLSLEPDKMLDICLTQSELHHNGCYAELSVAYTINALLSPTEALAYIEVLPRKENIVYAIFAVIDALYRNPNTPTADPDTYVEVCGGLTDSEYREACMRGVTTGIQYSSVTSNMLNHLLSVCGGIAVTDLTDYCFKDVLRIISGTQGAEAVAAMCAAHPVVRPYCPAGV